MARNLAYYRAEKKIEYARRFKTNILDLSVSLWEAPQNFPRLTELPDSLGQLTQLQFLNLSRNQLTGLPEWLGSLTRLKELDVSSNKLANLPNSLTQLTKLEMLDLSSNQLMKLPRWLSDFNQ